MNDADERRILLRMRDGADRQLLAEWLAEQSDHTPVIADSNDAIDEPFDLCLVDAATVEDASPSIEARRRMEPTFLPCLLLLPERSGADANEVLASLSDRSSVVVDEVITTPIQKRALSQRLETLFRMRELSQRLNHSRNRYHRLLEVMPETVLVVRDDAIEYVNEAGLDLLEDEEPSIVGSDVDDVVPDDERRKVAEHLRRIRTGERPGFVETAVETAAGNRVPVEMSGVRLVDDDDRETAVQVVIRDRSRRDGPVSPSTTDDALERVFGDEVSELVDHASAIERLADDEAISERAASIREVAGKMQAVARGTDQGDTPARRTAGGAVCDLPSLVESAAEDETAVRVDADVEGAPVRPRGCVELAVQELLGEAVERGSPPVQVHVEADAASAEIRMAGVGTAPSVDWSESTAGADYAAGEGPDSPDESAGPDNLDRSAGPNDPGLWVVRRAAEAAGGDLTVECSTESEPVTVVRFPRVDANGNDAGTTPE